MKKLFSSLLVFVMVAVLASCTPSETPETDDESTVISSEETSAEGSVIYEENATVGEGSISVEVSVETPEKTLLFTIMTDKTILGEALMESGIVEGEQGPYGLFIKKVNGISGVYETDGAYWAVNVNGEAAATGVDGITISEGTQYSLVYTKA